MSESQSVGLKYPYQPIILVGLYLIIRFLVDTVLFLNHAINTETMTLIGYFLDIGIVVAVFFSLNKPVDHLKAFNKDLMKWVYLLMISGAITHLALWTMGLSFPGGVVDPRTMLALLIIAPVLEELVFRFAVWEAIEVAINKKVAWILTSLIFGLVHLTALYWLIDGGDEVKAHLSFVLAQGVYTPVLGLVIGYLYGAHKKRIVFAVALHFAFNFGFFVVGTLFI